MAASVGKVIEYEDPQDKKGPKRSFGRARVEISVEKPLVICFRVPRPDQKDDIWVKVKYEKLKRYCFNYGRLGHENRACERPVNQSESSNQRRRYDASLCIPAVRGGVTAAVTIGGPARQMNRQEDRGNAMHGTRTSIDCMDGVSMHFESPNIDRECFPRKSDVALGSQRGLSINERSENSKRILKPSREDSSGTHFIGKQKVIVDGGLLSVRPNPFEFCNNQAKKGIWVRRDRPAWVNNVGPGVMFGEKEQGARFCVDLVDEIDDNMVNENTTVPAGGGQEVLELINQINRVGLKRGASETWGSPVAKRKKNSEFDSPNKAELRALEEVKESEEKVANEQRLRETEEIRRRQNAWFTRNAFQFAGSLSFSEGAKDVEDEEVRKRKGKDKRELFK